MMILLSTILIVSLTASVVLSEPIKQQTQQQDQDCGENCDQGECEPIENEYGYHHEYLGPGPHGQMHR
jgi:hypothetical protein